MVREFRRYAVPLNRRKNRGVPYQTESPADKNCRRGLFHSAERGKLKQRHPRHDGPQSRNDQDFRLRRAAITKPMAPRPSRAIELGSGTACGTYMANNCPP